MRIPPTGIDDKRWLSTALATVPGVADGRIDVLSTVRIGTAHGLSGRSARVRYRADGPERSVVMKQDTADVVRRELLFYREFSDAVRHRVPACIDGILDDHANVGLLVLEDVAPAEQLDVLTGCDDTQAHALVTVLGRLHAATWSADPATFGQQLPRWHRRPMDPARWSDRLTVARRRFPDVLTATAASELATLPRAVAAALDHVERGPHAWIHGDAHLDNALWRADATVVLLDWATSCVGPPLVDLAHCLAGGLVDEPADPRTTQLIQTYCASLAAGGVDLAPATVHRSLPQAVLPFMQGIIGWAGTPTSRHRTSAAHDSATGSCTSHSLGSTDGRGACIEYADRPAPVIRPRLSSDRKVNACHSPATAPPACPDPDFGSASRPPRRRAIRQAAPCRASRG